MVNENRLQAALQSRPEHLGNGHPSNGTMVPPPRRMPPKNQGYDLLGALLRRKGLLAFALTVSAILGYLYFVRQPKVYASSLKLMIWTQEPPHVVGSEGAVVLPSSTGKHVNLLTSQSVLSNAVEIGDLRQLKTFAGKSEPMYSLKGMVRVDPVDGAVDTLVLTAKGPDPTDLPQVLTAVVSAYQQIIKEDGAAINQASVELIEKLQEQLAENKTANEERYRELVRKLKISPDVSTGQFSSPYLSEITDWRNLKMAAEREVRDVTDRIDGVNDLDQLELDDKVDLVRVLSIEAGRYLSLDTGPGAGTLTHEEEQQAIEKCRDRNTLLEDKLSDLRFELSRVRRTVGNNHPSAARINAEIEMTTSKLSAQQSLLQRLEREFQNKIRNQENSPKAKEQALATSLEMDLIKWYKKALQRKLERLSNSIQEYDAQIQQLEEASNGIAGEIEELNFLAKEIADKDRDMHDIIEKMSNMSLLATNYTSTKVRVIDPPLPGGQVEPKFTNIMGIFLLAGSVLGVGLIVLLDWADLSYRNPNEIKERLGLPVVARISKMSHSRAFQSGHADTLVTVDKPKSPTAETYRACKTAMLFMAKQQSLKTFLITSPAAGDGKSTTSLNLAMCFAQGGQKTLIVDADLRRPRCHAYLGMEPSPGLKDFSVGDALAEEILRPVALQPNLFVITAGRHFSNPSQFIDSGQFSSLLEEMRSKFDIVIIDSPPVLPVADALSLASIADGVLLVMKIRKGVVLSSEKACDSLRSVNANILGVVVNQIEKVSHYSDYGKYGYNGYGGYAYYAGRYYGKANEKYYENEPTKEAELGKDA